MTQAGHDHPHTLRGIALVTGECPNSGSLIGMLVIIFAGLLMVDWRRIRRAAG